MSRFHELVDVEGLKSLLDEEAQDLTAIDAEALSAKIKDKVVGQDSVVDQIAVQLRRRFAAKRPDKPVAVFCFVGPPGVGKSYLAKVLAETIYGDGNHLQHVDLTQFSEPHTISALFGSPPGYHGGAGFLTSALRDVPDSVVLLDEVEKAHPDILKRFLIGWNDGFLTDTKTGVKVSTNKAIFVLTSNAAMDRLAEISRNHKGPQDDLNTLAKQALVDAKFAPEVLSRIDEVFCFRIMQGIDIAHIVALEIERAAKSFGLGIAGGGIDKMILIGAVRTLSKNQDRLNARDIARAIEKQISDGLIDAKSGGAREVRLVAEGDAVRVVPLGAAERTGERAAGANTGPHP